MDLSPAVVIDNGTRGFRPGLASSPEPVPFPEFSSLETTRYFRHARIVDFQHVEEYWKQAFELLKVNPTDCSVLLTERPQNHPSVREKVAEIMYEHFQVPYMYLQTPSLLKLLISNFTNGTHAIDGAVLDLGHSIFTCTLFDEATPTLTYKNQFCDSTRYGGYDITRNLMDAVIHGNHLNARSFPFETAESVKHQLAYVKENPKQADPSHTAEYTLPDGTEIQLSDELFSFSEQFFHSGIGDFEIPLQSIVATQLLKYIQAKAKKPTLLITGGCAMMKGLAERIKYELQNYADELHPDRHPFKSMEFKIADDPINDAWLGGASLASLDAFRPTFCLSKADYEESGSAALLAKFAASNVLSS